MKALKIIAIVWFAALLVGVPAAVLAGGPQTVARQSAPGEIGTSVDRTGRSFDSCIVSYPCYPDYYRPTVEPQPLGVERFLLLGETDPSDPGNSTTSFLMAFFALAALVAGLTGLVQKFPWLLTTALLSVGSALFVAAQLLWNSSDNFPWLLAFAFLGANAAFPSALGFTLFSTERARHTLKVAIVASLLVASVAVQSGIFYELIGTPDRHTYAGVAEPSLG